MKKRTWRYIQNPKVYGIKCSECGGTDIEWSEYENKIWCFKCEKDIEWTKGVFEGPIGKNASYLSGICFDKWDMVDKKIIKFKENASVA